jgi:hypothetical protein
MTVRKDWTVAQAAVAQTRYEARGGSAGDPAGPFSQWTALQRLKGYERAMDAGDKSAILAGVAECTRARLLMPQWLERAYLEAYRGVIGHKARGWDDVFGAAHEKGTHLGALRAQREHATGVWLEVQRRHAAGEPIDDVLFEAIGRQFEIGKTLAKKYYEHWDKQPRNPLADELLAPFKLMRDAPKKKARKNNRHRQRRK